MLMTPGRDPPSCFSQFQSRVSAFRQPHEPEAGRPRKLSECPRHCCVPPQQLKSSGFFHPSHFKICHLFCILCNPTNTLWVPITSCHHVYGLQSWFLPISSVSHSDLSKKKPNCIISLLKNLDDNLLIFRIKSKVFTTVYKAIKDIVHAYLWNSSLVSPVFLSYVLSICKQLQLPKCSMFLPRRLFI